LFVIFYAGTLLQKVLRKENWTVTQKLKEIRYWNEYLAQDGKKYIDGCDS
jgi:hypothetical protein